jgi:hypothetical protein
MTCFPVPLSPVRRMVAFASAARGGLEEGPHRGRFARHESRRLVQPVGQRAVLLEQTPPLDRALHDPPEKLEIGGLLEEILRSGPHGLHRRFDRSLSRQHDDGRLEGPLLPFPEHLQPGHARHEEVQDHEIVMGARGLLDGLAALRRLLDRVPPVGDPVAERAAERGVVIHDQHARARQAARPIAHCVPLVHSGTSQVKAAPPSGGASTRTHPERWAR